PLAEEDGGTLHRPPPLEIQDRTTARAGRGAHECRRARGSHRRRGERRCRGGAAVKCAAAREASPSWICAHQPKVVVSSIRRGPRALLSATFTLQQSTQCSPAVIN